MKNKQYALPLGLVVGTVLLGGCAGYTRNGKDAVIAVPTSIKLDPSDPEPIRKAQKDNIGQALVRTLRGEYDKVQHFFKKNGDNTDLVIWGSEKDGNDYRPLCGLNIDNLCDEYLRGRSLVDYLIGKDLYAFPSTGEIIHCQMSKGTAEYLDIFLHAYIDANNGDRCESWKLFVREHLGPRG